MGKVHQKLIKITLKCYYKSHRKECTWNIFYKDVKVFAFYYKTSVTYKPLSLETRKTIHKDKFIHIDKFLDLKSNGSLYQPKDVAIKIFDTILHPNNYENTIFRIII